MQVFLGETCNTGGIHIRHLLLVQVLLLNVFISHVALADTVSICADPDPPPWTYWVSDQNNKPTKVFVGASVNLLKTAFSRMDT